MKGKFTMDSEKKEELTVETEVVETADTVENTEVVEETV